jgi:hypothetical protein
MGERRMKLTPPRTRPLLLESDTSLPQSHSGPLSRARQSSSPASAVRPRSSSSNPHSTTTQTQHPNTKSYGCAPRIQSYPLERHSSHTRSDSRTRLRRSTTAQEGPLPLHGKGTVASLILITVAFLLVMTSIVLSPETIVKIIGDQKKWAGDARKSFIALLDVEHPTHAHSHVGAERGMVVDSHTRKSADMEMDAHMTATAGPVMSHDAWKTYLRRRQQVMGGAGATAHIEAWDFH